MNEIRQNQDIAFRYIPSEDNPADVASCGSSLEELESNELWWTGPNWCRFLETEEDSVDIEPSYVKDECNVSETVCGVDIASSVNELSCPVNQSVQSPFDIDIESYSSEHKLIKITALAMKFIRILKKERPRGAILTTEEMQEAEEMWIQNDQKSFFKEVINDMTNGKTNNLQKQLGLHIDQRGIIRCGGRLQNAELSESARFPILLPKRSYFMRLVIDKVHKKTFIVEFLKHCVFSATNSGYRVEGPGYMTS